MARALALLSVLAGCSEYEVHKDTLPATATATTPVTTPAPTTPSTDTPGSTGDTGSADRCFAPDFGYESNPAARLVTTDAVTPVTVTMVLSDTSYQDSLTLDAPASAPLMDAWTTPVGTAVSVGPYPVGTELIFGIDVRNTGDHWQSGTSSRNADGVAHVAVTYEGACAWTIGFEDLFGGGDADYNDVVFRVEGRLVEQ
jgi:hypothetical protein